MVEEAEADGGVVEQAVEQRALGPELDEELGALLDRPACIR